MSNIPEFPNFIDISLEHKDIITQYVQKCEYEISDLSFTNLYVWRKSHRTKLSLLNKCICILTEHPDNILYFHVPLGIFAKCDLVSYAKTMFEYLAKQSKPHHMCAVIEKYATLLKNVGFKISEDPANADYIYLTDDLTNLEGKKYDAKRNKIKRCLSKYTCQYFNLTEDLLSDCKELLKYWYEKKTETHIIKGIKDEFEATKETLNIYKSLDIFGGVIKINNKVEAFTIAEELCSDTAVIHFEKANQQIDGLYQLINMWFSKHTLKKYKYVNREQDLGIAGLIKSKQSYHPHHLLKKFIVVYSCAE